MASLHCPLLPWQTKMPKICPVPVSSLPFVRGTRHLSFRKKLGPEERPPGNRLFPPSAFVPGLEVVEGRRIFTTSAVGPMLSKMSCIPL